MVRTNLLPAEPVTDLSRYRSLGGGRGLAAAADRAPAAVVDEVVGSGLRGRGGAGFPTGRKWQSVREAAAGSTTYVVCNAAEGEPGTYKDRALIRANPFQLVEGILIAAHAVGASASFVGIKARFTEEAAAVRDAIAAETAAGWRGVEALTVVEGPDDYLFGEEKALLEVIEGKPAMPRILPPYMQGLYATMQAPNPTVVNNVETLCNVPWILADGAAAWRSVGTEESPGTMVFTVTGDCASPGVYELPLGTPLRTLVCDIAGAEEPKAVVSGVSNTVIPPTLLDLPMDFDSFAEAGTGLGSGGFVVYGQHRDMAQVTAALARFLAVESCGQCNACKLGTGFVAERLDRVVAGDGQAADLDAVRRRLPGITDANRCYLPVGAQLTIGSLMEEFGTDFTAALDGGSDPAVAVAAPRIASLDESSGTVRWQNG